MQPPMPGLGELLSLLDGAQQAAEQAQRELASTTFIGSAGGGLVRAMVSGTGELNSLELDSSVVDPADTETLADLIVAAVRDAMRRCHQQSSSVDDAVGLALNGTPDVAAILSGLLPAAGAQAAPQASHDQDRQGR